MGQFILNGRNYSGLTYAHGVFIDTDNIIYSAFVFDDTEHTWTATADCVLTGNMYPSDSTTAYYIRINGVQVFAGYASVENPFVYVMKGQVVAYRAKSGSTMKAYGIQMGSPVTFLSEYASACYDTNEREVGCWVDGKPLYQKCINYGNLPNNDERSVAHGIANVDKIFIVGGFVTTGTAFYNLEHSTDSNYDWSSRVDRTNATIQTYTDRTNLTAIIVVQYTKTTDVAGSGKLTPTAMPTVHYDSNEQVIGTFLGKTLYQRTWDITSGILVSYNGWTDTSIDSTNMENIVSVKATHPDGTCYEGIMADPTRQSHTIVGLQTTRNGNDARLQYVTIQYTKTT